MKRVKPVKIPRSSHPISRGMLSPNALRILYRLRDNGFVAFLVGGCVRDLLLGREPKDFDVVTDATPGQLKRLFRNCRLVGRRFRLAHLHFGDEIIEVSTFRSSLPEEPDQEGAPLQTDGRNHPSRHLKSEEGMVLRDNVFGTPEQDALRRDFTVNALFYGVDDFSIIDYAGGMADLDSGVIRTIGEPRVRMTEDPVRMLRAVRFAALLGFSIEPATWAALTEQSRSIALASPPRLYEEFLKLFLLGGGEKSYQLLHRSGLLAALFPHFNAWLETEKNGFPHTRISAALDRVDARIREGGTVPPSLLLALMFGEYIEDMGERFRMGGAPPQQALDQAVAEFLGALMATVQVPARVGMQLRAILACQIRFSKTPGRQPFSFIRRPGFREALDYLEIVADITGDDRDLPEWWVRFIGDNPLPVGADPAGEEQRTQTAGRKRKRRRRKRGRSGNPPPG